MNREEKIILYILKENNLNQINQLSIELIELIMIKMTTEKNNDDEYITCWSARKFSSNQ